MYGDIMKVIASPDSIRSPQYVIDRIGDFPDVGMTEFTLRIPVQKTEIYRELDEEVFSAFDWANRLACRSKTRIKFEGPHR